MCDDGEPPAKRSKYNLRCYSKPRKEVLILETISTTKLVDLNEDCLNELFGHLNVIELCYVSRVCKQLQQLAKAYFMRKYTDFDFSTLFQSRLISNQEARDVLSTFGALITSMNLQRQAFQNHEAVGYVEERMLKDVAKYCSKELKTLTLTGFCFTSRAVEALNLLSGSLTKLTLDGSVFADCVLHLINFSKLKILIVSNSRDCYGLLDKFPNLNTLQLINVSIKSEYVLHHFIVRHSQLRKLKFNKNMGMSSAVVRFVAKHMKNLQVFHFYESFINPSESAQQINENFLQLSELRNLEIFAFTNLLIGNLLAKMVKNKIPLKKLYIAKCLNDAQTIEAIVEMKNLEFLTLYRMINLNGEHLVKCAKELKRLKELTISLEQDITALALKEVLHHAKQLVLLHIYQTKFRLEAELYNDILYIVKERRNGTKLEITFYSTDISSVEISVPQKTIAANENWLKIKKILHR